MTNTTINNLWAAAICVVLASATVAVYWPVTHYPFAYLDDDALVYDNHYVATGLSRENFVWAWQIHGPSQWHPLAWLSHQLDSQLFGAQDNAACAGPHHRTNLLLHATAAVLLFLSLRRLTGGLWTSAMIASLFALHPIAVESVAWVAERRDVLSAIFFALTLWAYAAYAQRGGLGRYMLVLVVYALGLLSKPMLVTMPFLLLLLDYWPLRRVGRFMDDGDRLESIILILLEKLPLLAMSAISVQLSFLCETGPSDVSIWDANRYPLGFQIAHVAYSYLLYLRNVLWPVNLCLIYALPKYYAAWQIILSAVLLIGITLVAVVLARKRPYLIVGWLWYLGMLVPVISLQRVGIEVSVPDHWVYLPILGIYMAVVFAARDLVRAWPAGRIAAAVVSAALLIACLALTHRQIQFWSSTEAVFNRVLALDPNIAEAHNNLAVLLNREGRRAEALDHFRIAVHLRPNYPDAHNNLGVALKQRGEIDEPYQQFRAALQYNYKHPDAHLNLGELLQELHKTDEAIAEYQAAVFYKQDYVKAYFFMGNAYMEQHKFQEAAEQFANALRWDPKHAPAYNNLGRILEQSGRALEALELFRKALQIDPNNPTYQGNLRRVEMQLGLRPSSR